MPRQCGSSPTARCLSPTGRTPRPRSTWAVFGYWKPPIWTRHSRGRARLPSPAMRWARCANFFSFRLRNKDPAKESKQSGRRDFGRFDVLTIGGTSQREATPLAPTRKEEEKNSEISVFWLLRQRQIRWHDCERAKRHVRY